MTEKTKADSILEQIAALEKKFETGLNELKAAKAAVEPEKDVHVAMPDSAKGHKTIDEVADCPTCKAKLIEKFKPEILKEVKEKLKSKELVTCDGCGEIIEKQREDCPSCHGTHAH